MVLVPPPQLRRRASRLGRSLPMGLLEIRHALQLDLRRRHILHATFPRQHVAHRTLDLPEISRVQGVPAEGGQILAEIGDGFAW